MKKILAILTLSAAVMAGYAQGTVNMITSSSTYAVSTNGVFGNGKTFGTAVDTGGQAYYYTLLYSATSTAAVGMGSSEQTVNAWSIGPSATNGIGPGTIYGQSSAVMGNGGQTYFIELVGWSTGLGTSFSSIESVIENESFPVAGFVGFSNVGQVTTALSPNPGTIIFSPTGISSGFVLESEPIPEPSTIALGVMGTASLLALRRKKA